ncbi:MAG: tRNA pseudouridine(55) synthase TruB [Gemmatimonadales bacterium]|nr:tRNA pseudouridine(55) synthase TruB [Gemmatimonadales bacterium]MYC88168.1 tRNA pseudouridine(55) synthase TruB [Candidatus Palauibacter denitrificans]
MTTDAGLLLIDKPAGATSHDIVLRIRRRLGVRRIGHTGTLDPFATGLLLSLVGSFTRLADLYHGLLKSYDATMALGRETDTDDLTGRTVSEDAGWRELDREAIRASFAAREGVGRQVPSSYSARRTGGERAYALARRGERPELEAREVTIHEIAVTDIDLPRVRFRASVSTGTYIRALARDIGRDLGPGAHLTALRRTAIGPFAVDEATSPDVVEAAVAEASTAWRPGMAALPWVWRRELNDGERNEIRHGRSVERGDVLRPSGSAPDSSEGSTNPVALYASDELFAIAEARDGRLYPKKVFAA